MIKQKEATVLFVCLKGHEANVEIFVNALAKVTSLVKIEIMFFNPSSIDTNIDQNVAEGVIFEPAIPVDAIEKYLRERFFEKKFTMVYGHIEAINGKRKILTRLGRNTFEIYENEAKAINGLTSSELIDAMTH